jgi:hypothetical protein
MTEITDRSIQAYINAKKIFFSSVPADGRHSFNGLGNLVVLQTGHAPVPGHVYIFTLKHKPDYVKLLQRSADATNIVEFSGQRAKKVILICRRMAN